MLELNSEFLFLDFRVNLRTNACHVLKSFFSSISGFPETFSFYQHIACDLKITHWQELQCAFSFCMTICSGGPHINILEYNILMAGARNDAL
jgi:hypothetical protein